MLYNQLMLYKNPDYERLMTGVALADTESLKAFVDLSTKVSTDIEKNAYESAPISTFCFNPNTGEFSASLSRKLATEQKRVKGFANAISRWNNPKSVLDVGCGSTLLLGLIALTNFPKAEIFAVELSSTATQCAIALVEELGVENRVTIINGDYLQDEIDLPAIECAVTETFTSGLMAEPGPRIVRKLAREGIRTITPCLAEVRLEKSKIGQKYFPTNTLATRTIDL
jgi:SAM-dependent methyltransferase